jgi:hypothetical protein
MMDFTDKIAAYANAPESMSGRELVFTFTLF